ncbi:MAG TPA: hypothetical protein ACFYD6_06410 [Candidatus Brocadiia bacterium]|nr:hypothetical protein [Planctomycetota bacterium]MDO8094593.1 hypothetical protein [Candidatus Brocadiales bacterium]
MKPTEVLHPVQRQQTVELKELLSKVTSTHALAEPMFTKGGGLSDEKAILLIMRHLEDFHVPSSDNK